MLCVNLSPVFVLDNNFNVLVLKSVCTYACLCFKGQRAPAFLLLPVRFCDLSDQPPVFDHVSVVTLLIYSVIHHPTDLTTFETFCSAHL